MSGPTLGTHNLHDEAGRVTLFADAVGFTEAKPRKVRAKVAARLSRIRARLGGYRVRVCRRQRDLVFVCRRKVWRITNTRYVPVHGGEAEVTPHRGTFVIELERVASPHPAAEPEVVLLPHRINAAFPPYVRGEGVFRERRWRKHATTDNRLVEEYLQRGYIVHALGDFNTPPGVLAVRALPWEVGRGFDRIASTLDLDEVTYLGRAGSDHPRLRARLAR